MPRLDDLNRTERYFTSTLLGGLLLNKELEGTRGFLNWLGNHKKMKLIPIKENYANILWPQSEAIPEHIEVITELNIKRDIGYYGKTLNKLDIVDVSLKQNVPDVIIVYGEVLIVIEGKFFVKGQGRATIDSQLSMQKEEISIMVDYLYPEIKYTCHIFLGPDNGLELSNCDLSITWKDIEEFSIQLLGENHYITSRLKNANIRYLQDNSTAVGDRLNYSGKYNFTDIMTLCRKEGRNVRVGFQGGERALIESDYYSLTNRKFKWDYSSNSIGKKNLKNWLPGDLFLNRVKEIINSDGNSSAPKINNSRITNNYHDKTDLNGIISLCAEYGDKLLIGFSGGKNEMINTPKSKLETRPYKYDFVENSIGKKTKSNWLSGSEFMRILRDYFNG